MSESLNSLYMRDPAAAMALRKRAMAEALMKQGTDTSPVVGTGNTTMQALARVIQGGLGGFLAGRMDDEQKAEAEKNRAGAAGWNPLAAAVNGQSAPPPAAPAPDLLGGAPPASQDPRPPIGEPQGTPAPVPQVQREAMAAAVNGIPPPNMYGRNAGAAPARDALLDAPPQMLAAASAARSSAPQIPGGYREPGPQSEGGPWAAGLPPATGVIPGAGMGGPQQPTPQSAPPQPAPMPQQAPQGLDLNAVAQRIAAGLNDPNPMIRRQAQAYAQMLPALRQQSDRVEDRTIRAGERTQDRDWRTQDIAAQRGFASEQEQRQRAFQAEQAAQARAFQEQQQGRQLQQPPAGYQNTPEGQRFVTGGPADPAQAQALARARGEGTLPPQQITGAMLENVNAVRQVDGALAQLKELNGRGTGFWNALKPGFIRDWETPEATNLRAAIADIGSLKIHDRSGAAVSASEFPRLQPFIPSVQDSAATLQSKLTRFRQEYAAMLRDQYSVYGPQGGMRALAPVEALLNPQQPTNQGGGWSIRPVQ